MGTVVLWLFYILGQVAAILMRSDQSAMSKFTPWTTVWRYLVVHQNLVIYRLVIATALFWMWWHTPQDLGMFGLEKARLLPLNVATATIYGAFSDRVIDYVMTKFGCSVESKG